jgi:hypothetical protein
MQNRDTSTPKPQALPDESIGNLDNLRLLLCIDNNLQQLPQLPESIRRLINVQFVPSNKRGI